MATIYSLICWGGLTGKTVSISATTDAVTLTNHGLRDGTKLWPSGTLPAELNTSTPVYARSTGANTFTLHTSAAGAIANTGQIAFAGSSTYAAVTLKSDLVASPSTALSAYGLSDLSRWESRIYDGLNNLYSARSGNASVVNDEVCEIGEDFKDYSTSQIVISVAAATWKITTSIKDKRTPAFHGGVIGNGYGVYYGTANNSILTIETTRVTIDGFGVYVTGSGATNLHGIYINKPLASVKNMISVGYFVPTGSGFVVAAAAVDILDCVSVGFANGIYIYNSLQAVRVLNCCIKGNTNGFFTNNTSGLLVEIYNTISVGNTSTNWPTGWPSTSSNNAGLSNDAGGYTGGTPIGTSPVALTSANFVNYNGSGTAPNWTTVPDFRPVSGSPVIDAGVVYFGVQSRDISDAEVPNYNNGGAEAVDVGPYEYDHGYGNHPSSDARGLAFTNLVSGSKVKVFLTGTDTEKFSVTSSGTSETWSEAVDGSLTVDYVIVKAGYLPIRVTGVTVTRSASGIVPVSVQQAGARWYQSSSGLTINTNCFANATTKKFGLTTVSTLQNLASYLLEQWVELGDSGEAFANKPFPIEANGPNSFSWLDGWEADLATYANTITNLRSDGMRYITSGGAVTAVWIALMTIGIPSGLQMRYQQVEGAAPTNATNTGDVNQLIQVYSNGVYDYTGYLVCKVQAEGYDQAEVNVVTQYGTLEDQLYVIALNPQANSVAAGNPTVSSVTITDHGGSPVTWNSKVFSITITDSGTTPGLDIIQWIRHALATGGTFQGKDGFNWHDLVQKNGTKYKGVRGILYGDVGASLKGVRILRGTDPHPDFTLHTADDGTTVDTTPAEAATGTVSGIVSGSRLQVYNVTTATEMYNAVVSGTTYSTSYNNGTGYTAGDVVRVRLTYCSGVTAKLPAEYFTIAASGGWSVLASQENDTVYIDNGIDGSTVTEYSSDYVNVQIDISDPDNTTTIQRGYAWYCYQMTLIDGIRYFFDAFIAEDAYNYLLNTDVADIKVQNTSASGVTLTGGALRRKDGSSPIAAGGSVYMYYGRAYSDVVTVTGSNVVTGDLADIAPAVWGHGTRTLTSGGGGASADDVWNHNKALSVGKFLGLK